MSTASDIRSGRENTPSRHETAASHSDRPMAPSVPVMRPCLPEADSIHPYLRRIEASRIYSNNGPLCRDLAARLAHALKAPPDCVLPVANGTSGLTAALLAQALPTGGLVMVPDWTFPATANAVVAAGLVPYFVPVDADHWRLSPTIARTNLVAAPDKVVAVMPVAPYGQPVPLENWRAFHQETGLPVIIDAAACFDSVIMDDLPQVVSLHATKAFGIGEGGLILCRDPAMIQAARRAVNFGFDGRRIADGAAFNGKLSEYAAAVGLAALDTWPDRRARLHAKAAAMRQYLTSIPGVRPMAGWGKSWISSTCVIRLEAPVATAVEGRLLDEGIETRRWWPRPLRGQPAFRSYPARPDATADLLSESVIGLPFAEDISDQDMQRVTTALRLAVASIGQS